LHKSKYVSTNVKKGVQVTLRQGVNLIGYARGEFGLGEACRSAARALQAAGIPFCIINFPYCPAKQNDLSWKHKEVTNPIYNTNIFFINSNELYLHYNSNQLKRDWFLNRYNIGYWHWELPEFPDAWIPSFNLVNEVWVPSKFTFDSISRKTDKPVRCIPHAISVDIPNDINRSYFQLPENSFLFMTMYDVFSTSARKNPTGALHAFKQAFTKEDQTVGLVLKINNASRFPREIRLLKQSIEGYSNIYIIDKELSRQEVNGLMNVTDSLVSLHRSEGFGLPLAEAMYLGKPVIATNWSGNVDFMNGNNSFLVNYKMEKLGKDYGPYSANQQWAEPDLLQASNMMNKLVDNKDYGKQMGKNAQETIMSRYSPINIGNLYKRRLTRLQLL
jgi:glycosyltransferase involved in cell wall biosynthesis